MRRLWLLALVLLVLPARARAQAGISVWVGATSASDSGATTFDSKGGMIGVQLGLPLMPIGLRAEAFHAGTSFDSKHVSYLTSGVVQLRLTLLQLYGIAGWGRFAKDSATTATGWHAGAGARVGMGRLGAFLEVRRFDPVAQTHTILGVTF